MKNLQAEMDVIAFKYRVEYEIEQHLFISAWSVHGSDIYGTGKLSAASY